MDNSLSIAANHTLLVASTDPSCLWRVKDACASMPLAITLHPILDPLDFLRLVCGSPGTFSHIAGVIFHIGNVEEEFTGNSLECLPNANSKQIPFAWQLEMLSALIAKREYLPIIIINASTHLELFLHMCGVRVSGNLRAESDATAWQRAISCLIASRSAIFDSPQQLGSKAQATRRIHGGSPDTVQKFGLGMYRETDSTPHAPGRHRLSSKLTVDLDSWLLIKEVSGEITHLTTREMRVLSVLLGRPHKFVSLRELAYHLQQEESGHLERHRVVQTISGLRRKLNAIDSTPPLLITRRGLGYSIIPHGTVPLLGGDQRREANDGVRAVPAHQPTFA